ncbi:MAG: hypothetical protein KAR38_01915, partial [Calditrichia bacterium]|nr:hypothetical protein [Calditrichia bacterium]
IKTDTNNPDLLFNYAKVLKKCKKFVKAGEVFSELIEKNFTPVELIEEYSKVLEHNIKDYKTAIEIIEKKLVKFEVLEQLNRDFDRNVAEKLQNRLERIKSKQLKIG